MSFTFAPHAPYTVSDASFRRIVTFAEELDLPLERVAIVQGDTHVTINMGGASGSTGIWKGGVAMRAAAAEARLEELEEQLKVLLLPPDVNASQLRFTVEPGRGVRFGLTAIKNVGEGAIESLLAVRKSQGRITSLHALCEDLDLRLANKRVFESLVKAGAFDSVGRSDAAFAETPTLQLRPRLMAAIDAACEHGARHQRLHNVSGNFHRAFDTGRGLDARPERVDHRVHHTCGNERERLRSRLEVAADQVGLRQPVAGCRLVAVGPFG